MLNGFPNAADVCVLTASGILSGVSATTSKKAFAVSLEKWLPGLIFGVLFSLRCFKSTQVGIAFSVLSALTYRSAEGIAEALCAGDDWATKRAWKLPMPLGGAVAGAVGAFVLALVLKFLSSQKLSVTEDGLTTLIGAVLGGVFLSILNVETDGRLGEAYWYALLFTMWQLPVGLLLGASVNTIDPVGVAFIEQFKSSPGYLRLALIEFVAILTILGSSIIVTIRLQRSQRNIWTSVEFQENISSDNKMTEHKDDSIIGALQARQKEILLRLPWFAKMTMLLGGLGFLLYSAARLLLDSSLRGQLEQVDLKNVDLAVIIAVVLGLFSNLVIWVFVVWSMTFIPYIAYHAHRASRETNSPVTTRPLRWLQLYAATFLPMAVFAIGWNSFANGHKGNYTLRVETWVDLVVLVLGTGLVVGSITATNRLIPVRYAAIRLSFFSTLLYLSLFLAYGQGVTMASHAMVFGILLYLMFGAGELSELARRISLHDIDARIADRFEQIVARHDDVQNLRDETHLSRKEHEAQATKQKLQIEIIQAEGDLALNSQLSDMRVKKLALTKKMNEVQLQVIEKKIGTLGEVFAILSGEMHSRLSDDIPQQIEKLRTDVKGLTPEAIQARMNQIVGHINSSLLGIPESLADLRTQLLETSTEIERQTLLIAAESDGRRVPPELPVDASANQPSKSSTEERKKPDTTESQSVIENTTRRSSSKAEGRTPDSAQRMPRGGRQQDAKTSVAKELRIEELKREEEVLRRREDVLRREMDVLKKDIEGREEDRD